MRPSTSPKCTDLTCNVSYVRAKLPIPVHGTSTKSDKQRGLKKKKEEEEKENRTVEWTAQQRMRKLQAHLDEKLDDKLENGVVVLGQFIL